MNTSPPCSALGTRQETQQHVMYSQSSSRSRSTRALPCKRSTILCSAEPSTGTETLHRALWRPRHPDIWHTRPEKPSTNLRRRRWMARSAGNGRGHRPHRYPGVWLGQRQQVSSHRGFQIFIGHRLQLLSVNCLHAADVLLQAGVLAHLFSFFLTKGRSLYVSLASHFFDPKLHHQTGVHNCRTKDIHTLLNIRSWRTTLLLNWKGCTFASTICLTSALPQLLRDFFA